MDKLKKNQEELWEKLEESTDMWARTFNAVSDMVFVMDTNHNIVKANKAFFDIFKIKPEDLLHKKCYQILHKLNEPWPGCPFEETKLDKLPHALEVDDPAIGIPLLITTSPILDEDGELIGIVHIAKDITEHKRQDEELAASKLKMESMVKSMAEGVIMIDLSGEIVVANPQAKAMMGLRLDQDISDAVLYEKLKELKLYDAFKECVTECKFTTGEASIPNDRFLRSEASPVKDSNGKIIGCVIVIRDITKEKEDDKLKTEFVSMVSHELRTPLSIIKEGVSLVIDRIPGAINEAQEKILHSAKSNIDRLARIIDDLLDMSKIESGKVQAKKETADINELIRKVAASFEPKIKKSGLELKLDIPQKKIDCDMDRDKIIQVFTNLIGNAVKFTKTGYVEISCKDKGDMVELAVIDTGIGIAPLDIPKVFSKFQQFGRVAGGGEKGTGLGLAIVKGIIDMHDEKIWVTSELGKGTTVTFTLHKHTSI